MYVFSIFIIKIKQFGIEYEKDERKIEIQICNAIRITTFHTY